MRTSVADLLPILAFSGAFAPSHAEAKEAVDAIREAISARLEIPAADVEVGDLGLIATTNTDRNWAVELPRYSLTGDRVEIGLSATDANGSTRLRVSPAVYAWQTVPVATDETAPHTAVKLTMKRVRSDALRGDKPVNPQVEWEATTTLHAGQPVTTNRVRATPDKRKGDAVTVVARSGGVEIRTTGKLQTDAYPGETVPVILDATNTVKSGRWTTDGYVMLGGF